MRSFGIGLLVIAIIGLSIAWQISVWNECRETNSFWYCMRVISK